MQAATTSRSDRKQVRKTCRVRVNRDRTRPDGDECGSDATRKVTVAGQLATCDLYVCTKHFEDVCSNGRYEVIEVQDLPDPWEG